jgi:hypothetical protein
MQRQKAQHTTGQFSASGADGINNEQLNIARHQFQRLNKMDLL